MQVHVCAGVYIEVKSVDSLQGVGSSLLSWSESRNQAQGIRFLWQKSLPAEPSCELASGF